MKTRMYRAELVWMGLACAVALWSGPARAANGSGGAVGVRIPGQSEGVRALRNQDRAFSLLVEAFREVRCQQIRSECDTRLRAAAAVGELKSGLVIETKLRSLEMLQALLLRVGEHECAGGMQQVATQVDRMQVAYECARRLDVEELGAPVDSAVDLRGAAKQLDQYVVIGSKDPYCLSTGDFALIPAGMVLYDAPPSELPVETTLERCQ